MEVFVRPAWGRRRCGCRSVAGRGGGRSRGVALRNGTLAIAGLRRLGGRRRGVGGVGGRWWCVGGGLDLRRARLRFEDGVVAKTLAFAFLAIAAHGVGFVALNASFSARQTARLGAALDFLLVAAARQHARVSLGRQLIAHRIELSRAHAVVRHVVNG